jgi:hypothetical protein
MAYNNGGRKAGSIMKHYLTYREALSYFEEEMARGEIPPQVDGSSVLLNNLRDNHIFTVLHQADLLFQKEALLSHHRHYARKDAELGAGERGSAYIDHFVSTLSLKYYDDGMPGIPIVEDVVCDYIFEFGEFRKSLEKEGVYGMLNCLCRDIYCGGLFVEVKHYGEDIVGWIVAYYQERYPRSYMRGLLFDERDYYLYLATPEKMSYWKKSEKINQLRNQAREVWVQFPLFFERKQLEQLC